MEAALIGPLGQTVLGATKVTIGRAPNNTLIVSDTKTSAYHAEIRPEGQYYSLVDLGSTNGTFVNEQQLPSGVARQLQPGDTIRIGDTKLTFEVHSLPQSPSPSQGSTVRATPPPPVASTSYGVGNYGSQPNYQPTEFGHPPYATPAYSDPQAAYTPPAPSYYLPQSQYPPYDSQMQVPTYTPSSSGQTALPPPYTPPPQPDKQSPLRMMILAVIALVIILAAVGGFSIYNNNQIAQHNAIATATALTQAHNNATAIVAASATAIATSHYPPFTMVALDDPLTKASSGWDTGTICQFSSIGYQISIQQAHTTQFCLNSGQHGDIAYQVTMSINQGDCGGLIFRYIDVHNLFFFKVCANGQYTLGDYVNNNESDIGFYASSAIKQGSNQQNVLTITVQGDTINMYVNGTNIDTATNQRLTSSAFSQGQVGLLADDTGDPTTATYTNALVWTAS
jgi:hypothetical protein